MQTYRTKNHSLVQFYRSTRQAIRAMIWQHMSLKSEIEYCAVRVVIGCRY